MSVLVPFIQLSYDSEKSYGEWYGVVWGFISMSRQTQHMLSLLRIGLYLIYSQPVNVI